MHRTAVTIGAVLFLASGAIQAHGGEDHSHAPPPAVSAGVGDAPRRLADGSLFVPKPAQRELGIRTERVRTAELAATLEFNGKIVADPDAGGRVQATQPGSVQAGPKGMPTIGRRVVRGEVMAYLKPSGNAIERGNQRAQLADLDAQLAVAAARVKRVEQLDGVVPQKDIDAARVEQAALQKRRTHVAASVDGVEALTAPATGVVSATHVVAGQVVDAKEVLFEIVDPARLAVEALAYDPAAAGAIRDASAMADGATPLALVFVGAGRQLREQALPVLFRFAAKNPPVAVGQPVKVVARTAQTLRGIAVDRRALVAAGSETATLWVHTEAERFVARKVRQRPLDAGRIAVVEGLADGDRVVVAGATLLAQVR